MSAVGGKAGAAPPNPIERAAGMLREARNALHDAIHPPLSKVGPMKPYAVPGLEGVKVSAAPVAARGAVITWRVTVERGGAIAGTFETRLTRQQLGPAQFRPQADGTASPLRRQVADVLRAPQKRLLELGSRVEQRNAPGGANLQATIVAKQEYRDGAWRHVEYAVGQVQLFTRDPVHAGQKREALGYHRRSIGRGETIRMPDGSRPTTLAQAQARVRTMLEYGGLTPVSSGGARSAAESGASQQRALQDLSARLGASARPGADSPTGVQLRPWTSPVAMPGKAFREWTPTDRVGYTVEVAKQQLPPELARQLQALLTPQTVGQLAAYGAAHMVGVGWVADATALGLSAPGAVEGTRAFGRYLQTTMQARHPMELVTAGRQLSEIAAPLVVDGGAMLGAYGATRAVRALKPAGGGALARTDGLAGVAKPGNPPVSLLQWELARDPLRALSTLRRRVEQGGLRARPEDVLFAMETAQQAYRQGPRDAPAKAAAKAEIAAHLGWAQSLLEQMRRGPGAPRRATTPTGADAPGGPAGALARADAVTDAPRMPAGGGRLVEYSQPQQWPQQSQRRRDAAPDPRGSWSDASRFMAAMTRAHDAEGRPMHLRLQPTASGDVSVVVDPSRLDPSARAAYDRLEQHVGTSQLERALGVLIAGDGKESGLHGLADVWRTLRPQEPLRGRTLVDLGRVLSGRGDFGTLDELGGLSGFQAGTYRGIFPFTENHAQARSWIGAHGTGAFAFGLGYMDDLPTGPPTVEQLKRSPWVLQHLRNLQNVYDDAVRHEPNRNRLPPDHQPWTGSQAPGFVDSAAAVHAFWATLRSAGPTESVMPILHIGENLHWDAAAARAPALDGIDFRVYPAFHEAVREGLRELMQPFHPVVDLAGAALLARRIAEQTFEDEALRAQLRGSLAHLFTDPRAMQAYGESKHFEQAAQSLVLDRLEQRMQLPLDQPWSSGRLREAARQWAAERAGDPQTPLRRLRTLETLLNDPAEEAARSMLAARQRLADIAEGRLFQRIEQMPRQFGFEPARDTPRVPYEPATSLHEAIANHLARHGVVARVRTGAVTEFIVDRAATSSWRRALEINPAIAEMMGRLCRQLSDGGARTTWRFRTDSQ